LAQAENSYRTGDSNTAAAQAETVLPIAQAVTTSAQEAKSTALVSSQNAFWSTIAFTVIGAFVFVLALFLVWRWFKRSYIKSLSEAKPGVNSQ
jgi:CHASE3 domain sensor protein